MRFLLAVAVTAVTALAYGIIAAGAAADPVIAAAGDIACDPGDQFFNGGLGSSTYCHEQYTSDILASGAFTAVLPLGDDQYECASASEFAASYDPTWGRVKTITYPVPGNHEYLKSSSGVTDCDSSGKAAGYFGYFGAAAGDPSKGYYSYDIGSWHLIALNTNSACVAITCGAGSPQEQWLRADLAAHPAQCTLAYWHHPLFTSTTAMASSVSAAFWQDLYAASADIILNGHAHNYERFAPQDANGNATPNGIREFIVGTGGKSQQSFGTTAPNSEVRNYGTFGVLELTLHPGSYDWKLAPEAGRTFTDSGSGTCHHAASDTTPPTAPTNLGATGSAGSASLSWTPSTDNVGVTTYDVYRSLSSAFVPTSGNLLARVSGTSYVDSALPAGTYYYVVEAEDAAGNVSPPSNQAGATVTGANTAPTPAIAAPSAQTTWKVDDAISFSGSAVDAQDGTLPAAALTWTLILHDCSSACQTRVVQASTGVATGSVTAPDAAYPSYLELQLAATDSAGLTGTTSVRLDPQTVTLTFASSPSGLQLVVGSSGAAAPYSRTVVVRSSNTVSATSPQTLNGTTYTFSSWSDGGAQAHTIVAPASPTTYTASFSSPSVLLGDQRVEPSTDDNATGSAEAFKTTASASGQLAQLSIYLDSASTATKLLVGFYADASGHPGALLAQASITVPAAGTWNSASLATPVSVTAGTSYWIALLVPSGGGTIRFRDVLTGSTQPSETSTQTTLTGLPSTWSTGSVYHDGPLSAYGTAGTGVPVLVVSPSSLSFSAVSGGSNPSGQQVSVSNGGGGLLAWNVATDASWLTVTPTSGVGATTLTVAASVAGLAPGTYTGTVTVTASGVQGSPQAVAVTLTVAAPPPPPPPPPPPSTVLVGDQQIAASTDYNPAGTAEAYRAVAGASGNLTSLSVYLDPASAATTVIVGVYSDASGRPGTLLAQGAATTPAAGAWNNVTVPATAISSGAPYWVAILAPSGTGTVRFRDSAGSGGACETSAQTTLTALPATWTRGTVYTDGPLSLFGATS